MKIVTWNINGIRALPQALLATFMELDADIICLQETKISRDQLDYDTAVVEGYNSFYSFCKLRSGYSGVAIYCKEHIKPIRAEDCLSSVSTKEDEGIGCYCLDECDWLDPEILASLDSEGRSVMLEFETSGSKSLVLICVYCPRAEQGNEERMEFKLNYHRLLQLRAEALINAGKSVIIAGDINISHLTIDHCATADEDESSYSADLHQSFLAKPLRHWLNHMLIEEQRDASLLAYVSENSSCYTPVVSGGFFVDAFRHFFPTRRDAYTCWCSRTGARKTNYGNRIDYILISSDVTGFLDSCDTLPSVMGSDHCPVVATFSDNFLSRNISRKLPSLCTKFLPELVGKQKKISDFFTKSQSPIVLSCGESKMHSNFKKVELKRSSSKLQGNISKFFPSLNKETCPQVKIQKEIPDFHQPSAKIAKLEVADASNGESEKDSLDSSKVSEAANIWKSILKGPEKPPLCAKHKEACLLRTVKKDGPNKGKRFWVCPRPEGATNNPEARCNTFLWVRK